ncbi:hypothetical protein AYO47_05250 [Planctomyces sp. SCGC AG-212-M04]|nr:hypothetical protein AYO47_05250 [Planctomyces sp. SCGC AG-212-M04]
MNDDEVKRLGDAALAAYRAAREALRKNPVPGSSEWDRWMELFVNAADAHAAYSRVSPDRQPH